MLRRVRKLRTKTMESGDAAQLLVGLNTREFQVDDAHLVGFLIRSEYLKTGTDTARVYPTLFYVGIIGSERGELWAME